MVLNWAEGWARGLAAGLMEVPTPTDGDENILDLIALVKYKCTDV
jgi:hypothetical protein